MPELHASGTVSARGIKRTSWWLLRRRNLELNSLAPERKINTGNAIYDLLLQKCNIRLLWSTIAVLTFTPTTSHLQCLYVHYVGVRVVPRFLFQQRLCSHHGSSVWRVEFRALDEQVGDLSRTSGGCDARIQTLQRGRVCVCFSFVIVPVWGVLLFSIWNL